MKKLLLSVFCAFSIGASAQVTFNANGNSGFGSPVGGSSMTWDDDGTTITVNFTKGAGDFNDDIVIYLSTGATGRTAIGTQVNDRGDRLRSSISFMEAATGHALNFPAGFQATHAIAINTTFGGLWAIPSTGSIGNAGLTFVSSVSSTLSTVNQASFSFSFTWANLGLNANDPINLVATYLNPFGGTGGLVFASNEGYGSGLPGSNIGQAGATFTTYHQYPSGKIGGTVTTAASGDWTDVASWTNGYLPFNTDRVVVNHNLTVDNLVEAGAVEVTASNTLTILADERLSVTGGVTGAGSFVVDGIFRLNAGGFTTIVPTYGASTSQLTYNTGGSYNISSEWPAASSPASIRIINSSVVLSGNRNVTGLLDIESGCSLDVNGHTLSLKASSESDYSQLLNNGTLTGNVTFERAITGSTAGWRFLSPAVSGTLANFGTVQLNGTANAIKLNTANPNAWEAQGGAGTDAMVAGRGYALYFGGSGVNNNSVATTLSLTGSVQNGDVTVTGLSDGNGGSDFGWTLVGNPYPSGLDWSDVNHVKTNITDAYYVWNPTLGGSGQYASYVAGVSNPGGALDGIIPPMQGFLVKASAASPVLTFSAQGRSSSANKAQMRVNNVEEKLSIRVTNLQNQQWDEATLVSRPAATAVYEGDFDALKLNSFDANAVNLSSISSDQRKLSINSLGAWDYQTSVPMHLKSSQSVAMQIQADLSEVDPVIPVFLEDVLTNQIHDLRAGAYRFVNQPAQTNRFILHFNNLTASSVKAAGIDQALVYVHEGNLFVKGLNGTANIRIFDMAGRQVHAIENGDVSTALVLPTFAKGTYLIQVEASTGLKSVKVIF